MIELKETKDITIGGEKKLVLDIDTYNSLKSKLHICLSNIISSTCDVIDSKILSAKVLPLIHPSIEDFFSHTTKIIKQCAADDLLPILITLLQEVDQNFKGKAFICLNFLESEFNLLARPHLQENGLISMPNQGPPRFIEPGSAHYSIVTLTTGLAANLDASNGGNTNTDFSITSNVAELDKQKTENDELSLKLKPAKSIAIGSLEDEIAQLKDKLNAIALNDEFAPKDFYDLYLLISQKLAKLNTAYKDAIKKQISLDTEKNLKSLLDCNRTQNQERAMKVVSLFSKFAANQNCSTPLVNELFYNLYKDIGKSNSKFDKLISKIETLTQILSIQSSNEFEQNIIPRDLIKQLIQQCKEIAAEPNLSKNQLDKLFQILTFIVSVQEIDNTKKEINSLSSMKLDQSNIPTIVITLKKKIDDLLSQLPDLLKDKNSKLTKANNCLNSIRASVKKLHAVYKTAHDNTLQNHNQLAELLISLQGDKDKKIGMKLSSDIVAINTALQYHSNPFVRSTLVILLNEIIAETNFDKRAKLISEAKTFIKTANKLLGQDFKEWSQNWFAKLIVALLHSLGFKQIFGINIYELKLAQQLKENSAPQNLSDSSDGNTNNGNHFNTATVTSQLGGSVAANKTTTTADQKLPAEKICSSGQKEKSSNVEELKQGNEAEHELPNIAAALITAPSIAV